MSVTNTVLGHLDTYLDLYSYVSKGQRQPQEVIKYLESQGRKSNTAANHVSNAVDGKLPYIIHENGKLRLDNKGMIQEITNLISRLNVELWISEKNTKTDNQIPTVTTGRSQNFELMNKERNAAIKKCKKLEQELVIKEDELNTLKLKESQNVCKSILEDMGKKVLILKSVISEPREILAKDFFRESPGSDISWSKYISKTKAAIEIESSYCSIPDPEKALTVTNVIQHVCNQFKNGSLYKKLMFRKKSGQEELKNSSKRERAIELLLANTEMDNQTKLSTYALWYFRGDPEMEELLTYAGNYCIDANYVIRFLEQPDANSNQRTIKSFLKQAMSASEAHIKLQTVQELLCGDWEAVANYRGKMCHFKLVPMEELELFRDILLKSNSQTAACEICQILKNTSGPMDQKPDPSEMESYNPELQVPEFLHAEDGDVDIHAPVDEDIVMDHFQDKEELSNE